MSEWFYKKVSWLAGCLAVMALFGLAVFLSNIEIKDMDLWLHLAAGRHILETFSIPRNDIFSCTIAGTPWINHEWLFQIIVSSVYQAFGFDGLIGLNTALVVVALVVLLFLGYTRERQFTPIFLLLLVLLVYQLRLTLRPDMFSLLFFACYIVILGLYVDRWWALGAVLVIQVLWVNTHGFFLFGPILIMVNFVSELIKRRIKLPFQWNAVGRLSESEFDGLKRILVVAVLACFVNPYFARGAWYPFGVLFSIGGDSKVFFSQIQELQSTLTWETAFTLQPYLPYKLLIVLSLFSFCVNYRKIDLNAVLLWLVFLAFSLGALRNIAFFAFAAYFVFLSNFQYMTSAEILPARWDHEKLKAAVSTAMKVALIVWVMGYADGRMMRGYYDFDRYERKSEYGGVSLRNFPYKAVDFLIENDIKGNFFNDFNSGSYLIGRAWPNVKVFIDGRTEMYGGDFYNTQKKIWEGDPKLFEEAVERYQLTGVFLNSVYVPAPEKFIRYLYGHPQWALVYFDYDAAVFLKNIPENKIWTDRYRVDLSQWRVPDADLLRIGTHDVIPYRHVNRAYALYNMGLSQKAMEEAQQALRIDPGNGKAHKLIGKIQNERGEYAPAFESLRKAKLVDPGDMKIRYQIALALLNLGKIDLAREQCQRVLNMKPDDADALSLMARIEGQSDE